MSSTSHFDFFYNTINLGGSTAQQHAAEFAHIRIENIKEAYDFFYKTADKSRSEAFKLVLAHHDKDFTKLKTFFDFCYSSDGLDLSKREALERALDLEENFDIEAAKKWISFFYSSDGMDLSKREAQKKAMEFSNMDFQVSEFSKTFKDFDGFFYSSSGADMSKKDSKNLAFDFVTLTLYSLSDFKSKFSIMDTSSRSKKKDTCMSILEEAKQEKVLAQSIKNMTVQPATYAVGCTVEAYWSGQSNTRYDGWYLAKVTRLQNGQVFVQYNDYPQWGECLNKPEHVRFAKGSQVQAYWKNSMCNGWFPACIIDHKPNGAYVVEYTQWPQWGHCESAKEHVRI